MRGVGDHESLPVAVVEADGDLARQLQMLALVVTDGYGGRVVEQDVRRHEHRVGEEADTDRLLALALVLELRHAAQLAHGGRALEEPCQTRVLGDLTLDEEGAAVGVEPHREQVQHGVECVGPERLGRDLRRERVEVNDAVEGVVAVLEAHPVPQRAEVVAQREVAGGRDAREDAVHRTEFALGRTEDDTPDAAAHGWTSD